MISLLLVAAGKRKTRTAPNALVKNGSSRLPTLAARQEAASSSSLKEAPRTASTAAGRMLDELVQDFTLVHKILEPSQPWFVCRGTLLAAMWDEGRFLKW